MSVGPSLNDDSQGNAQFDSRGEGLQAFIDDSDLLIKSSQDVIYNSSTSIYIYIYIYICIYIFVVVVVVVVVVAVVVVA